MKPKTQRDAWGGKRKKRRAKTSNAVDNEEGPFLLTTKNVSDHHESLSRKRKNRGRGRLRRPTGEWLHAVKSLVTGGKNQTLKGDNYLRKKKSPTKKKKGR